MKFGGCLIKGCHGRNVSTDDRKFLIQHYRQHFRRDLNNIAIELGIHEKPYTENRFSLVNALIDHSIVEDYTQ